MNRIIQGDCLNVLPTLPKACARLLYLDPPFNTGSSQRRTTTTVTAVEEDAAGDRHGFGGRRYRSTPGDEHAYDDDFDDFIGFLLSRIEAAMPCLTDDASIFVHLDWREVHYAKVALDQLLGRDHFMNEIIWAYDFGGRSKKRWPTKHDSILWYVRDRKHYIFDYDAMD
ncbi:MAG: DNA methyltransferase, partial [Planctomycetota bacterium]